MLIEQQAPDYFHDTARYFDGSQGNTSDLAATGLKEKHHGQ